MQIGHTLIKGIPHQLNETLRPTSPEQNQIHVSANALQTYLAYITVRNIELLDYRESRAIKGKSRLTIEPGILPRSPCVFSEDYV